MSVAAARQLAKTDLSPTALASLTIGKLEDEGSMASVSQLRVSDLIQGFAGFLLAAGIPHTADIAPFHADAFVHSLTRGGAEPSLATMHLRRSALRIFFKEAKALGFTNNDPSADVELPPRTYRNLRPLTDEEIDGCRSFAAGMVGEPAYVAAWALAEASARVPELGQVTAVDCDLDARRVRLPGCSSTLARWASLTDWGYEQLANLLTAGPKRAADEALLNAGSRGSTHELVTSTLRRAGIAGRTGIRTNSVPAWRGAKELDDGATIDEVTRLLGMRSLDRAAFFIGFDWKGGV